MIKPEEIHAKALLIRDKEADCVNVLLNSDFIHADATADLLKSSGFRVYMFERMPKDKVYILNDTQLTDALMKLDGVETVQ